MAQRMRISMTEVSDQQLTSLTAFLASDDVMSQKAPPGYRFDPEDGSSYVDTIPMAYLLEVKRSSDTLPRTFVVTIVVRLRLETRLVDNQQAASLPHEPVRIQPETLKGILRSLRLI